MRSCETETRNPMSIGCGRHKFSGRSSWFRMPALGSQASRFIEGDARVVANIHVVVVNPRRPLAGEIDLGARGSARKCKSSRQQTLWSSFQRGSLARHGVGSHPEASGIFLKCAWVMRGSMRYCGSVTTVVTTSQVL